MFIAALAEWLSVAVLETLELESAFQQGDVLFSTLHDRARDWIGAADGPWQYLLVFIFAATPWLEILIVIPIGVGLGLEPVLVAVFAFAGNVLPIYGIVRAHERLAAWLETRRESTDSAPSSRRKRAQRLWDRYGLPGLALAAPIVTGVHLAAMIALGFGSHKRATVLWMTVSIAVWTVGITAVSVAGVELLGAVL